MSLTYHMYVRACLFFLSGLLLTISAYSQVGSLRQRTLQFDQLPTELGLNERTINDITQDKRGYLWVASWSGLIRYDGYNTKIYLAGNTENSLQSNEVTALEVDGEGNLWVGSRAGGVAKYNYVLDNFERIDLCPDQEVTLGLKNVSSILYDSDGYLWVATSDGIVRHHIGKGENLLIKRADGLTENDIISIGQDEHKNIWAGTYTGLNKVVFRPDGELEYIKKIVIPYDNIVEFSMHNAVSDILIYQSRVFYCTRLGLKEVVGEKLINHSFEANHDRADYLNSILLLEGQAPDEQDYFLVGSEVGLHFFNPANNEFEKSLSTYKERVNLTSNRVSKLFIDDFAVLWVGTQRGINYYNAYDKQITLFKVDQFDTTLSKVTGIQGGEGDHLWISTSNGGVFNFDGTSESFKPYFFERLPLDDRRNFIRKMVVEEGRVWVATDGAGVLNFDPEDPANKNGIINKFERFHKNGNRPLSQNYIMALKKADDGGFWVGTWTGFINKINPDGSTTQFKMAEIEGHPVNAIIQTSETVIWAGTKGGGLFQLSVNGKELKLIKHFEYGNSPSSIASNFINTIHQDQKGDLWVGTENGLNQIRTVAPYHVKEYSKVDNLHLKQVYSVFCSRDNKLWASNDRGITVFAIHDDSLELLNNFDVTDDLQGAFLYTEVTYESPAGELFFGGPNGFNVIEPQRLITNPNAASLSVQEFSVNGKSVLGGGPYTPGSFSSQSPLLLKHDENSISFDFVAMHFAAPRKNELAFRLKGFEDKWHYRVGDNGSFNYTNLTPGDYILELKGSNNDSLWKETHVEIFFTISRPWWTTNLAIMGYIISFALLIYLARMLVLARINFLNELKFERLRAENVAAMNKSKLEFFTNVSHEFRTPLTMIKAPLEILKEKHQLSRSGREQLKVIDQNVQRMLRLINQLLDFRKSESHKLKLKVSQHDIVQYLQEIKFSFDSYAAEQNITLNLTTSSNEILLWFDAAQLEKVFVNLISNALKHVPQGGEVNIRVFEFKEEVHFEIEDNGPGIEEEVQGQIFNMYYSTEADSNTSTGIGLALSRALVRLHSGELTLKSERGKGAKLSFRLKKGKTHLVNAEWLESDVDQLMINEVESDQGAFHMPLEELEASNSADSDFTILVVEDNKEIRELVKGLFIDRHKVLVAADGKAGLALAIEEVPDLIISDVMMPVMDGMVFCKKVKEHIATSHIPVILLTARTSYLFQEEGFEKGADDYITKPFEPRLLVLKVRNILNQKEKLLKKYQQTSGAEVSLSDLSKSDTDSHFLGLVQQDIYANMDNTEYTVNQLAKALGMSRMQLFRKVKGMTGEGPNELIRKVRLQRAAELLASTGMSVSEVTYAVGFNDLSYFRKCFKAIYNQTPKSFQMQDK